MTWFKKKKRDQKLQSKCPFWLESRLVLLAMIILRILVLNIYITIYKIGNQWEIAVYELLELT